MRFGLKNGASVPAGRKSPSAFWRAGIANKYRAFLLLPSNRCQSLGARPTVTITSRPLSSPPSSACSLGTALVTRPVAACSSVSSGAFGCCLRRSSSATKRMESYQNAVTSRMVSASRGGFKPSPSEPLSFPLRSFSPNARTLGHFLISDSMNPGSIPSLLSLLEVANNVRAGCQRAFLDFNQLRVVQVGHADVEPVILDFKPIDQLAEIVFFLKCEAGLYSIEGFAFTLSSYIR